MSTWRVAETDHLLVYAGDNDERLVLAQEPAWPILVGHIREFLADPGA